MNLSSIFVTLILFCGAAFAATPLTVPEQEQASRELFKELRCMTCQSESVADSNAELAQSIRALVRERLKAGASPEDIKTYLVARYGDYILMKPPLSSQTAFLWFGPLIALLLGGGIIYFFFRRQRT